MTIPEHAEAHRLLFEEHGHWQDLIAWKSLSGMISKEEIIKLVQSEAAKDNLKSKGNPWSGIRTKMNFAENAEHHKKALDCAKSTNAIEKRKETFQKIAHQQGEKNSQFGTCWITHKELGNKTIKKELLADYIFLGYVKGRVIKL